jgi:hypothetical protein
MVPDDSGRTGGGPRYDDTAGVGWLRMMMDSGGELASVPGRDQYEP